MSQLKLGQEFLPAERPPVDAGRGTIIRAKSPLRISFSGGGTDFPSWYEQHEGAVLCTTINRFARVTLYPRLDKNVRIRSVDLGHFADYQVDEQPVFDGALDLIKAAIRRVGCARGLDADVRSDAPSGSGLGGSSALVSAALGAVTAYHGCFLDRYALAEMNHTIERTDLRIPGGRQDQYASTFGGFNLIEFSKSQVLVNPLRIRPEILNDLEEHLLLCYTGVVRANQGLIAKQLQYVEEKREQTLVGMHSLYDLVFDMKRALLKGDLKEFGGLLHDAYENKKKMNPGVSTGTGADELYEAARKEGATGGKLMGAGGGGYLLIYCETHCQHKVKRKLEAMGGQFTDFAFEESGLQFWRSNSV